MPRYPKGYHHFNCETTQLLKQPDVVMLTYLLPGRVQHRGQKRANFEYYEARTLHKSSLSPSIHAIIGIEVGDTTRAVQYFERSALVDLTDNQGNTGEGMHIASAGGTWQILVNGFGGLRILHGKVTFKPWLPPEWEGIRFRIRWRGRPDPRRDRPQRCRAAARRGRRRDRGGRRRRRDRHVDGGGDRHASRGRRRRRPARVEDLRGHRVRARRHHRAAGRRRRQRRQLVAARRGRRRRGHPPPRRPGDPRRLQAPARRPPSRRVCPPARRSRPPPAGCLPLGDPHRRTGLVDARGPLSTAGVLLPDVTAGRRRARRCHRRLPRRVRRGSTGGRWTTPRASRWRRCAPPRPTWPWSGSCCSTTPRSAPSAPSDDRSAHGRRMRVTPRLRPGPCRHARIGHRPRAVA